MGVDDSVDSPVSKPRGGGKKTFKTVKKRAKYRNYTHGDATGWNNSVWKKYIPNVESQGIKKSARILSQSYGGQALGLSMYYGFVR